VRPADRRRRHGLGARRVVGARGTARGHIRCDNGPELTANAFRDWCRFSKAGSAYIEPGSPWQNPYVESFGSRVPRAARSRAVLHTHRGPRFWSPTGPTTTTSARPHSALHMMAPIARTRCQEGKCGQPIAPRRSRRGPQNATERLDPSARRPNQPQSGRRAPPRLGCDPTTHQPPTLTAGGPMNGVQPRTPRDREGSCQGRLKVDPLAPVEN